MKGLSIMSGRSCILWCSMIALFVFPAVPLAGDTKPRLRASSFLCHDFSDAPQSRFVEMSDKAFGRECEKLRKELEDSYNAYYMMLDDGGRRELFESEVFWEKYLRCYQKNLCDTLDRPLLIFTGEAKSPVITNVYREIVTDILRWRINDLKRWEKGRYLSNANNSTEDIERKLSGERRRYTQLKSDAVLLRYVLYHYDRRNMDKTANLFGEKKLDFLENRTSDKRTLRCEQLEMRTRGNRVLEMISAGLRGVAPVIREEGPS